ncbi:MAG: hypothetical protein KatS3mg043_1629 [Rhodothermaceae bacterium]|nr:MAG: hypothetical protein KatS3mg043_1629 [Rhodothermaceae bacterium]
MTTVVDLLFEKRARQTAHYVCRKLYTYFVQAGCPDEAIVAGLAETFLAHDFEIAPVVKQLLKSAHFYEGRLHRGPHQEPRRVRHRPVAGNRGGAHAGPARERPGGAGAAVAGPGAVQPAQRGGVARGSTRPDAGGLPGHYAWLTNTTLPERWAFAADLIYGTLGAAYDPVELAMKLSDPSDPFALAVDLAETMIPVPLEQTGIREVSEDFAGMEAHPLPPEAQQAPAYVLNLTKLLLDGLPHYGWPVLTDPGAPQATDARTLLRAYLAYLVQLPAYQLT